MDKKKIKKEIKKENKLKKSKTRQKNSTKSKKSEKSKQKFKSQKGGRELIPEIDILGGNKHLKLEKLAEDKKLLEGFPDECVIL